jgi:hypothetical protein
VLASHSNVFLRKPIIGCADFRRMGCRIPHHMPAVLACRSSIATYFSRSLDSLQAREAIFPIYDRHEAGQASSADNDRIR